MEINIEKLKYPIGKFIDPADYSASSIEKWKNEIESYPARLKTELSDFTEEMLEEHYRPGGWTARQVVHHVADSHMNGFIRFKLTLTEDLPAIKPYFEARWADLADTKLPVSVSLTILEAIHKRWIAVIRNTSEAELERRYFHPENKREYMLKTVLALYAWHGNHHLEHIRIVKRKFAVANQK